MRAFLFKLYNNTLAINTRVSHFNRNVDRNCELCNIIGNPDPEDESILHLFYNCTPVESLRTRLFTKLLGRDLTRQEFFVEPNFQNYNRTKTVKMISLLLMYFVWESKKRFCIPSYGLFEQYYTLELQVMRKCSKSFDKIIENSGLNF
jgi:hypothetical protein